MTGESPAERGRRIVESGRHAPPRGEYLGTLECWGIDVYENSPSEWKTALFIEYRRSRRAAQ